jgi:hypothetical protein
MRPAILRWKVSLALLAVVGAGAILGSVLHSPPPDFFLEPVGVWPVHTKVAPPLRLMRPHPKVLFILGPAPRTPQDRLRAWLYSALQR